MIRSSLVVVQKTLKGLMVMSFEMEKLAQSIFLQRMPAMWTSSSYPTMRPLLGYATDLYERLKMLQDWMDNGPPPKFWISGFFFTHAFFTGVLQNFARRYKIPIDTVGWNFKCMPKGGTVQYCMYELFLSCVRSCTPVDITSRLANTIGQCEH